MVKLTVHTPPESHTTKEKADKQPLCDAVELPLEKQTVVRFTQKGRFCTKCTAFTILTILFVLVVGGAVLGLYLKHRFSAPRCMDWGPDCEMKGPPVPPELYEPENDTDSESDSQSEPSQPYDPKNDRRGGGHHDSSSSSSEENDGSGSHVPTRSHEGGPEPAEHQDGRPRHGHHPHHPPHHHPHQPHHPRAL